MAFHMLVEWWTDTLCPKCDEVWEMHWHARSLDAWTMCPNCAHTIEDVIELHEDDERV